MQRVSEIDGEPIVGKFYLVPCITDSRGNVLPVLGSCHDDEEYIGIRKRHYHYDVRFVTDRMIQDERDLEELRCSEEEYMMTSILFYEDAPTERRVRCRRQMPTFPLVVSRRIAHWIKPMEQAYKKVKLNCAICPHRGFSLKGLPEDEDRNVVCAGHGLKWNLHTGKLVSRL